MHDSLQSIKPMRKKIGLSQAELAKKSNVSQSLIAKIESGKLDPTFSKAKSILNALNSIAEKDTATAKDIMQTKIISTSISEKVDKIIQKMQKHNISQMPVLDRYVIGLVSETSILEKIKSGKNIQELTAKDVMAEAAPMVPETTNLETISNILKQHPIIIISKHGDLSGVITKADLLKKIYKVQCY